MKKILGTIFILFLTIVLVACVGNETGDGGLGSDVNLELDTSKNVTITFWHRMGGRNETLLGDFITEFKVMYPHITVDAIKKVDGSYNELNTAVSTAIPARQEPHMVESYGDHVAGYMRSGRALSLNNFLANRKSDGKGGVIGLTETEVSDFVPGYWEEGKMYDDIGSVYSVAFSKSTEAMFYNKTFFDANNLTVPKTWDEVETISQTIKNMPAFKDNAAVIPFGYDSTDNLFITASIQKGIPYTSTEGGGSILFNNQQAKDMVLYFKDLYERGLFTTRTQLGNTYTSTKFVRQELFMAVGSTGGTTYNIPEGSEASTFEVGVAPVPQFDLEKPRQAQQGPNINLFRKSNPQEELASWLFLKYLTSPEVSARFAVQSGYSPVRQSSYQTKVYTDFIATKPEKPTNKAQAEQKAIIAVLEMGSLISDSFFTTPVFSKSAKVRQEVGAIFGYVFAGQNINTIFQNAYEESSF